MLTYIIVELFFSGLLWFFIFCASIYIGWVIIKHLFKFIVDLTCNLTDPVKSKERIQNRIRDAPDSD